MDVEIIDESLVVSFAPVYQKMSLQLHILQLTSKSSSIQPHLSLDDYRLITISTRHGGLVFRLESNMGRPSSSMVIGEQVVKK